MPRVCQGSRTSVQRLHPMITIKMVLMCKLPNKQKPQSSLLGRPPRRHAAASPTLCAPAAAAAPQQTSRSTSPATPIRHRAALPVPQHHTAGAAPHRRRATAAPPPHRRRAADLVCGGGGAAATVPPPRRRRAAATPPTWCAAAAARQRPCRRRRGGYPPLRGGRLGVTFPLSKSRGTGGRGGGGALTALTATVCREGTYGGACRRRRRRDEGVAQHARRSLAHVTQALRRRGDGHQSTARHHRCQLRSPLPIVGAGATQEVGSGFGVAAPAQAAVADGVENKTHPPARTCPSPSSVSSVTPLVPPALPPPRRCP